MIERGFRDSSGKTVKRDSPLKTRTGIVIYKGTKKDFWVIDYPDGRQYGAVTTIKLINLLYHLGRGKNLDEARDLSGLLT